jgi:hypothetical protein
MKVLIHPNGQVELLYRDELQKPLEALGSSIIERASSVEPGVGGWYADLAVSGGPVLGPYPLRQAALDAEVAWLESNRLGVPVVPHTPGSGEPHADS